MGQAHGSFDELRTGSFGGIGRADDGRPLWPDGVVGTITHTAELGVAAVAQSSNCAGLGLDIEDVSRKTTTDISRRVCTATEKEWVGDDLRRLRTLFSAKESIFKALFPRQRIFLGFQDAELTYHEATDRFVACLLKQAAQGYPRGFEFWLVPTSTRLEPA